MRRFPAFLLVTPLVMLLAGCGIHQKPAPAASALKVGVGNDPWVLLLSDFKAPEPALLWNGLVGLRLGRFGTGTDSEGKSLPAFRIDAYEQSGEEKIIPQESHAAIDLKINGNSLFNCKSTYVQALDMKKGELATAWDAGANQASTTCFVVPGAPVFVQKLTVLGGSERFEFSEPTTSRSDEFLVDSRPMNGQPCLRIETAFPDPDGVRVTYVRDTIHGAAFSGQPTSSSPTISGNLVSGQNLTIERVVCFWHTGSEAAPYLQRTFDQLKGITENAWAKKWNTDIQIDGPIEDQQAIHSFLFYLRSAIDADQGKMAISPMGLSSDIYNGHVFWDADIWVFPALALIEPEEASAISQYRLARLRADVADPKEEGRYPSAREWGPIARYPWESSVTGKEVAPGEFRNEVHVTGDVLWELNQAAELDLAVREKVDQAATSAAKYFAFRRDDSPGGVTGNSKVISPDEGRPVNNDLYTNLLAQWLLNDRTWKTDKAKFELPHDDKTFLTYDNDALRGYKQAAAVLSIYPLQYPPAEAEAKAMMNRFADKVIKNGPAMTDSVHALIWARLGETDKAYQTWKKGWKDFTDHPFLLFSEKRGRDRTYFTTGAAGCLQTMLYGFLGFRIDLKQTPKAVWTHKLRGNDWISVSPNLPKEWKSVTFKNFSVLGRRYTLTATHNGSTVSQGEP